MRTASQLALPALAVVSLCAAVFGLAYLTHEREHIRDLDAASNAHNAMLSQARSQSPDRNLDVGNPSSQGAIQRDGSRRIQTRRPHQQKQTGSAAMRNKAVFFANNSYLPLQLMNYSKSATDGASFAQFASPTFLSDPNNACPGTINPPGTIPP